MAALLRRQSVEEAGREAGAEDTDRLCQHSSTQHPGERLPVDALVDLQQGVALIVVLRQGRRDHTLAGLHQAPHQIGFGVVEVGRPGQGKEEPQRPSRCPPNFEEQGREGFRDHWLLPCKEGGAADGARASPTSDDARNVVQGDGAC